MTFGPCQATNRRGKLICLCEAGIYVSTPSTVESDSPCLDCNHPLSGHLGYGENLSSAKIPEEGIISVLPIHSYFVLYSNPSSFSESLPSSTPIPPNQGPTMKRVRSDESPPGSALITNAEEQSPKAAKKKRRVQPSSTVQPKAPDLCPRSETVAVLAKMLEEQSIVHVRGTPASGKTSLALLLRAHLTSRHNVVFIPEWTPGDFPGDILVNGCQRFGYDVSEMDLLNSQDGEFVFIIDESQLTYTDSRLWYTVIKSRLGSSYGPWFCLFASYGSPSNGSPDYPTAVTPPILSLGQRVSLVLSTKQGSPGICLFFGMDEFEDVVARYCKKDDVKFTLAEDLQRYIFALTNGHPGMIRSLLVYIETVRVHT